MEDNKKFGNAYMERNKIELFVKMAIADHLLWAYEDKFFGDENEEDEEVVETEKDINRWHELRAEVKAFREVRELMHLNDEYDRFKLLCVDSQMSYMEECGKYDEIIIKRRTEETTDYYDEHYDMTYDSYSFGCDWQIEKDIWKNGWSLGGVFEYCKPNAVFKHKVCENLFDRLKAEQERRDKLMKSYSTLEEAKGDIDPTEYNCMECGASFYAEYRSKYSPAPRCPICGTQDWLWIE